MHIHKIQNLISNKLDFNLDIKFCAIIGLNPSQGARSPMLWNKAYKRLNQSTRMISLDCNRNNIEELINVLDQNINFIGGAITIPHKEKVAKILKNRISKSSAKIGAINCLFRDGNSNLFGTNTDGEAALVSLEKNFGILENEKVLVLGNGGTAKAVISYLLLKIKNYNIKMIGRNKNKNKEFEKNFRISSFNWECLESELKNCNILINCTSIGWGDQKNISPINDSLLKKKEKEKLKVFDVIYDPNPTKLIESCNKYSIRNINGLEMNLEQAVLAFLKTNNLDFINFNKIKEYMGN